MTERDLQSTADLQEWQALAEGASPATSDGSVYCTDCARVIEPGQLVQMILWVESLEDSEGGQPAQHCALCRLPALPREALDTRRDTVAVTGTLDAEGTLTDVSIDALHPPTDRGRVRRELHVED